MILTLRDKKYFGNQCLPMLREEITRQLGPSHLLVKHPKQPTWKYAIDLFRLGHGWNRDIFYKLSIWRDKREIKEAKSVYKTMLKRRGRRTVPNPSTQPSVFNSVPVPSPNFTYHGSSWYTGLQGEIFDDANIAWGNTP